MTAPVSRSGPNVWEFDDTARPTIVGSESAVDTTQTGECLYSVRDRCWDGCYDYEGIGEAHQCYVIQTWPITKKTEKRIYFRGGAGCTRMDRERTSFIEVVRFDEDGSAYHRVLRQRLHLTPPEVHSHRPKPKNVSELKREMADAHPDRGGSREAFETARGQYLRAKRVTS